MDDQNNWLQEFVEYVRDTALVSVSGLNEQLAKGEIDLATYKSRQVELYQSALSSFLDANHSGDTSRETIEQVSESLSRIDNEIWDSLSRYSLATVGSTVAEIGGHAFSIDSYFSEIAEGEYDQAFGTASSIIIGMGVAASIPATIPVVVSAALGGLVTLGLERALVNSGAREYFSTQLSEMMFALSQIDLDELEFLAEEIATSINSFATGIGEAGLDSLEEIDAFLAPLWANLDSGITLESSWSDWEFAAHDVFDQQPTFANAETITSPIIIDLDGDGVETTTLSDGVYFDHDGNGLAEKTAWAASDDGLLVIDRNGDGVIDSGAELFGNNTELSNGTNAANGFEALAEFDSNADGVIDADDESYSDLRIWRDFNQDGVSQADELFTLDEAGVSAIGTGYQSTNSLDENGNRTFQAGTATLADGTEVAANDVWFQSNTGLTQTVELLQLSPEIAALPTAQGFGNLHNLDQAMSRDSVLAGLVTQYVASESADERRGMIDALIYQWAGVSDVDPHSRDATRIYGHLMDARQLETLEELVGQEYLGTWCWGERDPNPHGRAAPVLIAQYQQFADFVFAQLEAQTSQADLFDQIGVRWDAESLSFMPDMAPFIAALEALVDQGDIARVITAHELLEDLGAFSSTYTAAAREVASAPALMLLLASNLVLGTEGDDVVKGSEGADLINAQAGDDQIVGGAGDDTYIFELGDGTDAIYDRAGADTLKFGEGMTAAQLQITRTASELVITRLDEFGNPTTDQIVLQNLFDFDGSVAEGAIETLTFADGTELSLEQVIERMQQIATDGIDQLYGTEQDDHFNGDKGDDQLYGGAGDDTYYFERGDGQDEIFEHSGSDILSFGAGIGPESLQLIRTGEQGEDILVQLLDEFGEPTSDGVLIRKAYQNLTASDNQIEWLSFEDDLPDTPPLALIELVKAFGISDSDDLIYGFESNDRIDAGSGNDTVHAAGGDDLIQGGAGDDQLFGEAGDDFLDGGEGNDLLNGGSGDDCYRFSTSMGHDRVLNTDAAGFDRIEFDADISEKKLQFSRLGDGLFISHNRNAESMLLEDYFDGDRISETAVDQFRFADGSTLGLNDIAYLTMQTTQGDDFIQGLNSTDRIAAQAGNDLVFGGGGDDHLFGEQGTDQLFGDAGNDVLDGGGGQDQLTGGLGEDQLFGGPGDDFLKGNAGADKLYGERGDDQLLGGSQNDLLDGGRGDDLIEGGFGNDQLFGGKGMDTLTGGAGNDQLDGGQGNDIYLYRAGDGDDQILRSGDPEGFDMLAIESFDQGDLWLTQRDDDLIVSFRSEAGSITVDDWFADTATLDVIELGKVQAYATDIERMVEAMVAFDAAETESELADAQMHLSNTLSESWHLKVG